MTGRPSDHAFTGHRWHGGLDGHLELIDRHRVSPSWQMVGSVDDFVARVDAGRLRGTTLVAAAGYLLTGLTAREHGLGRTSMDGTCNRILADLLRRLGLAGGLADVLGRIRDCFDLHADLLQARELAARLLWEAQRISREAAHLPEAIAGQALRLLGDRTRLISCGHGGGRDFGGVGPVAEVVLACRAQARPATLHLLTAATDEERIAAAASTTPLQGRDVTVGSLGHAAAGELLAAGQGCLLLPVYGIDAAGWPLVPSALLPLVDGTPDEALLGLAPAVLLDRAQRVIPADVAALPRDIRLCTESGCRRVTEVTARPDPGRLPPAV